MDQGSNDVLALSTLASTYAITKHIMIVKIGGAWAVSDMPEHAANIQYFLLWVCDSRLSISASGSVSDYSQCECMGMEYGVPCQVGVSMRRRIHTFA